MHTKNEWINLHYQVLYAKYIYYKGVSLGFKPMSDVDYDLMEDEYKKLSEELGEEPTAVYIVGWKDNAVLEALAMKQYNRELYEEIKHLIFEFKD